MSTGRLAGKIALITGAGSVGPGWGNGRASAIRFAEEGALVFATDIDQSRLDETLKLAGDLAPRIKTGLVDILQSSSIEQMVKECIAAYGKIDILMNNVGGSAKGGPVEMPEEVWDTQVDYNLKSVFLTCKYVLPHMVAANSGSIINMASTSGMRWTGAAQVAYAATKAGVIQLSKVVAVQYAKQNIRVNTIVPGQLHTPMVETRLAGQRAGGDVQALLAQRQSRIPLPFMGDGRDTANAAVFLASDESRFITGTEIVIDGGMSARCD
ncbi:SDR family NAD(P)-dependent oxidoreductase [Polynucleobacter kasalickyi]|uniref:NAD(P)-dependent dehydrogenase, short-chain alcohol dehydrogenase family n=1 Tax=Polynucleobacter kasalickyi TaxID=1938817 RepID=A0A1W1Y2E1_9BURK|nr:SDR family oxidoreductase [Polynucleobacter kasalickyi]SMC30295.1 NAD(P)-dependent dehydrogenase, short-chain alcohol dehydrogenase family [Polynucleobacter kasalickyi]